MSLLNVLTQFVDERLAEEGITAELLEMVDLEIAYSPVLPFAGGMLEHAVKVLPWGFYPEGVLPDKFEVQHPLVINPIGRDALKIMRARYLLARDAYYGPIVRRWVEDLKIASEHEHAPCN